MYSGTNIRGAALKAAHLLLALSAYPHFGRWISLAELVALAAAAITLFLRTLLRAREPSRWSLALRLGGTAVLLCFGFSSCSPGGLSPHGRLDQKSSALLSGDTTHGPAVGTYYYHSSHTQSTSVITDASGNEVTRMVYLPFGEVPPANSSGADTVTAKYTGQEYDDSFGLYYYNARYYDPVLGRFLNPDSIVPDPGTFGHSTHTAMSSTILSSTSTRQGTSMCRCFWLVLDWRSLGGAPCDGVRLYGSPVLHRKRRGDDGWCDQGSERRVLGTYHRLRWRHQRLG